MKKYLFVLITLFIFPISVFAKEEVTLAKCVDGDTCSCIEDRSAWITKEV